MPPSWMKRALTSGVCLRPRADFDVVEVNASDARNKAQSEIKGGMDGRKANMVKEMIDNTSVRFGGGPARKIALIMDEVDGMSGGDRGGVADLIDSIKTSKIPIICICNDRHSTKLKSLLNHVTEYKFARPTKVILLSPSPPLLLALGLLAAAAAGLSGALTAWRASRPLHQRRSRCRARHTHFAAATSP